MVRCTKGLKGIKGAGALILALSLTFAYPAVSWAVETEALEGAVTYGPGSYVVGEDILPGEYAVLRRTHRNRTPIPPVPLLYIRMIRMSGALEPSSFSTTD